MRETYKRVEKGIYKRGDYSYQVKMMIAGNSISETFDTLDEARAYRDMKRAGKAIDPDYGKVVSALAKKRDAATMTLAKALTRYENEVTPSKKGAIPEKFRIGKLKRYDIAKRSLYRIGPDDIIEFLAALKSEGLSENSRRKYASLISHVYTIALKRWRLQVNNPIPLIELPSNGKPRKRRLEPGEERKLFRALAKEGLAMRALVRIAIETASRRGELLKLKWKDIQMGENSGTATYHDTKNGEGRVIPLAEGAVKALRSLPKGGKNDPVFNLTPSQIRDAWERARRAAGCPDLRFHDLRHEGVSKLFDMGFDSIVVARVSGHKSPQVLKGYAHPWADVTAQTINEKAKEAKKKSRRITKVPRQQGASRKPPTVNN